MGPREEIIWSIPQHVVAKKRQKKNKAKRLPTQKDLRKLEREAIREMRRSNADLGVG